jgi:hypothetical protein
MHVHVHRQFVFEILHIWVNFDLIIYVAKVNTCMSINFTYQDINLYILMLRLYDNIFIVLLRC